MKDNELLQAIYNNTQELKTDVQELKERVTAVENRVGVLENTVAALASEVTDVKSTVTVLASEVTDVKTKVTVLDDKVTNINLVLENEIRVNIQRVAEGHLDLSRNLHEALKIDHEKEMMSVRINVLETEMHKTIERLDNIARSYTRQHNSANLKDEKDSRTGSTFLRFKYRGTEGHEKN